jgi:hypothetical protein
VRRTKFCARSTRSKLSTGAGGALCAREVIEQVLLGLTKLTPAEAGVDRRPR